MDALELPPNHRPRAAELSAEPRAQRAEIPAAGTLGHPHVTRARTLAEIRHPCLVGDTHVYRKDTSIPMRMCRQGVPMML
jgi:hypothetical protein